MSGTPLGTYIYREDAEAHARAVGGRVVGPYVFGYWRVYPALP